MASHAYYPPSRTQTPPTTTTSQVTVVHNPHQPQAPTFRSSTEQQLSSSLPHAPTPPSIFSEQEQYGPQRMHGSTQHLPPVQHVQHPITPRPTVRFNAAQLPLPMAALQDPSMGRDFKDDLARAAGAVTPGVDDSPYIQYALDLMTKRHGEPDEGDEDESELSQGSGASYPGVHHIVPNATPGLFQPAPAYIPQDAAEARRPAGAQPTTSPYIPLTPELQPLTPLPYAAQYSPQEMRQQFPPEFKTIPLEQYSHIPGNVPNTMEAHEPLLGRDTPLPREIRRWQAVSDTSDHERGSRGGRLTYKPRVLQTPSLAVLAVLNLCMVAALMLCAIWSYSHGGLSTYSDDIYKGDYFVFRILPQLLGAIVLIYTQSVTTVAFRIQPFSRLASDDTRVREKAVFESMYLKSFLFPTGVQDWKMAVVVGNSWLLNLSIPLLSALFIVVRRDGRWAWTAGQGVAWTLVALYILSTMSTIFMMLTWRHMKTGLRKDWDLRSLADFILLASQSNSASKYRSTEVMATQDRMKDWFCGKDTERLGFWDAPESAGPWYGLGVEETIVDEKMSVRLWARGQGDSMSVASGASRMPIAQVVRSRYLPWCLRNGQIMSAAVAAIVLAVVLIAVSSTNTTSIRRGFRPGVEAGPSPEAFSAANFLWTFVPSLLGMVLFLVFQSYDLEMRILAPWAELAREDGSCAETSLLLEYAAATMPWEATWQAVRNKHWRVALTSFVAPVFVLIPVLAGGMFIALLIASTGEVRMFPQMIAFGIMLGLVALYAVVMAILVPNRAQFRLPHAVTSLAEILSFCSNDEIRNDTAFADFPLTVDDAAAAGFGRKQDLAARLDAGQEWHRQGRWTFSYGRNNDERLGIKRYSRFTVNPRRLRQYDRRTRGELISQPMQQRGAYAPVQ
ncbi:uncharacterized protein B0I36DRAFT_380656 [Microdochium trichocladiopsis]|uniref:Phosphoribosylaminoimidazole-succinocarboxamide synthase n=1 Tax=Microdochium trichocladiopsis TaxID=1682393 RepID=A0A9P9BXW9_9PEZI|nr:uncharacterized protein B0I36DRAFT_380656 [Microdochium trichocladiopsis]KAH7037468.1 hypothetical protein B0I36DRAFT_380656 [Microdochium trichocladiopsis]